MGLRDLRIRRKMTQKELAAYAGMSRGYYADYERGDRPITNMTLGNALKLADALKVKDLRKLLESDSTESER